MNDVKAFVPPPAASIKGKRLVWTKDGFQEGRVSPELLPEGLRSLPGELVTKEIADEGKIHAFDPPHVRESILDDAAAKQAALEKPELPDSIAAACKLLKIEPGIKLSQAKLDVIKMRIIGAVIHSAIELWSKGKEPDLQPQHLWFDGDSIEQYALRAGNAPAASDRPKHLRHFDLSVDPFNWPRSIMDALNALGYPINYKDMNQWKKNYKSLGDSLYHEQLSTGVEDSVPLSFSMPIPRR